MKKSKQLLVASVAAGMIALTAACGTGEENSAQLQKGSGSSDEDIESSTKEDEELEESVQSDTSEASESDDTENKDGSEVESTSVLSGELTVSFLDVGQGDATLFQTEEATILIDAGRHDRSDVVEHLESLGVEEIDVLAGTHPHADHIGQMADVISSYPVHEIWMSGGEAGSQTFERTLDAILASEAAYEEPRAGDVFEVGDLLITMVHPVNLTGDLNEDSLSMNIEYGDIHFLLTGDAEHGAEAEMLERNEPLEATILKAGHHGSSTSSTPDFVRAVMSEAAIYSAGVDNQYGHPHEEVRALFSDMDISFYGTAEHGTLTVVTDGAGYDIYTEKEVIPYDGAHSEPDDTKKVESQEASNDSPADCIDLNGASADELMEIIHIGEERALALIDQRPFDSVKSLTAISGIGDARVQDIKDQGLVCSP
ncbi:MBL fold metallo-hydrolase [Alteribacter lacisalsi]|uniref:MBL fold metallo-hydrolase n=1 Tax=Alteribacter lacisalsi TaxID=2045244 RepID=UPI001374CB46|nr:MBL fold metallo-hydrolase [Alteribacter lacisalsi]